MFQHVKRMRVSKGVYQRMLLLCHYLIWWRNLPAAASGKLLLALPRCRLLSKNFSSRRLYVPVLGRLGVRSEVRKSHADVQGALRPPGEATGIH